MQFPRWLTWLFLLVLGYMIYATGRTSREVLHAEAPQQSHATPSVKTYPRLAQLTDVEAWKRKLNPSYAAMTDCDVDAPKSADVLPFKIIEEQPGEGEPAPCGNPLDMGLTVWSAAGNKVFSGEVTLAIGAREVASGLDAGLAGIRPHGVRMLVLPAYARVHAKSKPAQEVIVTLRTAMEGSNVVLVRAERLK